MLRLHEEGEGRSVLRVGPKAATRWGSAGQHGVQQQRQGVGATEEVQAVLPIPGLHVSVRHVLCQVAEHRAVWTHNGTGVSVVHSSQ